mmetsp:Transcript_22733/g.43184  ORF Transcript_22733/g.43184 Transcript_22733/m.43184 type:complete len:1150 (+) Transcript_22733:187-3636(+)|eukprot:scaffold294_cov221-Amphora_coffeaeformis.AAC.61
MSAAVAPADRSTSSGSLVMNPLQVASSSQVSRHASLHALSEAVQQQQPALKKRKIGENGTTSSVVATSSSIPSTKGDHHHNKQQPTAVSVTEPNSSCDSIPLGSSSASNKRSSSAELHVCEQKLEETDKMNVDDDNAKNNQPLKNLTGDGDSATITKKPTTENTHYINMPALVTPPTPKKGAAATTATLTSAPETAPAAEAATKPTPGAPATATATAAATTNSSDATSPATAAAAATTNTTPHASTSQGSLSSSSSKQGGTATAAATVSVAEEKPPPLKSTKMSHLRQKYTGELEYMLREFEKLERQLLGARKTEESAASRERREKLHSFILHLTETIQQIEKGCDLEAAGKSTLTATQPSGEEGATATLQDTALAKPPVAEKEEENVQKLEEHILANLLPVKVRLKKQLAAQQGAKHNPATMPHRGAVAAPAAAGTTFADSARRQQEAAKAQQQEFVATPAAPVAADQTQFGKPLVKGSSLTKKLHGPTLGSSQRAHGDGVGATSKTAPEHKKKYVGGLAVGSAQMDSSFDAASNVHTLVIQEPALVLQNQGVVREEATVATQPAEKEVVVQKASTAEETSNKPATMVQYPNDGSSCLGSSEERRRRLRRKKRKKMRLKEQVKAAAAEKREMEKGRKQKTAKKSHRGPRHVEYMCALCNEVYNSTCDYNPWWALSQHDCPKCRKRQIPRIDIGAPANAIEYHPALLAHAEENGGVAPPERCTVADVSEVTTSSPASNGELSEDESMEGSDLSSEYDDISTDDDIDSLDSENDGLDALSPADRAEQERFGADYSGPRLEDREASRLLILMAHASTCPCQHNSHEHAETCRSVKWMMLHVRDCPGTTSNYDVCPFPWCRKVKHLLYHLVSCQDPLSCNICAPADIGKNLVHLKAHSEHRLKAYRRTLLAKFSSSPKKTTTPVVAAATPHDPDPPAVQAQNTTGVPTNQPDASQNTTPAAPPVQDKSDGDTESSKAEAPMSEGSSDVPVISHEPMASAEDTKSSSVTPALLDHPGAAVHSVLVDKRVEKSVKHEGSDEYLSMDESTKAQHAGASEHKSEPTSTDQSSVTTSALNADGNKTAGDGSAGEQKQPDAENAAVADSRGARVNAATVKTEEAEEVVPDKAATSEFGTLVVDNTNAGEKTSEPLKVQ